MTLVLADVAASVSAVAGAVAAVAAVFAIGYAKQAADAARETVREGKALRVEEDFRELGRALVELQRYADDARQMPGASVTIQMHHAQARVRSVLVTPVRVHLDDDALTRLDAALNHHSDAATVYSAAARLVADVQNAWDAHMRTLDVSAGGWPSVDGLFGAGASS